MTRNYYYLVAGLPDIALDEGKGVITLREFLLEVHEQLETSDRILFKLLQYPFDNSNLIAILENKDKFDARGNYSREELTAAIKNPDILPEYMQTFLDAYREGHTLFPGHIAQDQLEWLFYDEMAVHKCDFIREWFSFEQDLRNCVVGINCRKSLEHIEMLATDRERPVASLVIGNNEIAEAIIRSNAPDFGLGGIISWAENLFSASKGSLIEFEKTIDILRWNMLNELTLFSYFGIETILAFSIKLNMVERWRQLDPKVGRERLDMLVEELRSGFSVPQGF